MQSEVRFKVKMFLVCLTCPKLVTLVRLRKAWIHAHFYFMWYYKIIMHPRTITNIWGWTAEEHSWKLLTCMSEMNVSLISRSCYLPIIVRAYTGLIFSLCRSLYHSVSFILRSSLWFFLRSIFEYQWYFNLKINYS